MPLNYPMYSGALYCIFPYQFYESTDNIKNSNLMEIDDNKDNFPINLNGGTRGLRDSRGLIENNAHGGSWVDSFKDDAGVDWKLSRYVRFFTITSSTIRILNPLNYVLKFCPRKTRKVLSNQLSNCISCTFFYFFSVFHER